MKAERGKNILGSLNRGSSWVRSTMIPPTFQKEIKCSTAYGIKKRFQLKDFRSRKILLRQHCLQSHQQADTNNFFLCVVKYISVSTEVLTLCNFLCL